MSLFFRSSKRSLYKSEFAASPSILDPGLIIVLVILVGIVFYFWGFVNFNLFGILAPDYDVLKLKNGGLTIDLPNHYKNQITYEKTEDSIFTGTVRHIALIQDSNFPYLTHDILVTSGDFAQFDKVGTIVLNHKFFWQSQSQPKGTINLLHVLTLDKKLYNSLMQISGWQKIKLVGHEIYKIDLLKPDGTPQSYWKDEGCNTLLIKSVTILP
jgi:hypothetical protein